MADSNNIEQNKTKRYLITNNELKGKTERILNSYQLYYVGIGNRLKQLFTNMRLHKGHYDTINIHWPIVGQVESPFKELFELKAFPRINEINHSIYLDNKYYEEGTWQLCLTADEKQKLQKYGLKELDFGYNSIPQEFINLYLPYFNALYPSKYVQSLIDTIKLPQKCVALHIRHMADWKRWNRWNDDDIELFIKEMHKYDDDTYFYAACQCKEVRELIISEFKERIIALPRDYDKKDNIRDVADMYLLSKPKKLIATYGSTFSECVWWLSGCKQEVTVIGSKDSWKNNGNPYTTQVK